MNANTLHPNLQKLLADHSLSASSPPSQASDLAAYHSLIKKYQQQLADKQHVNASKRQQVALNQTQADQLQSRLIASINHEIRTPLNAIYGLLELLLQGELEIESKNSIKRSHAHCKSVLQSSQDVLHYAQINALDIELDYSAFIITEQINQAVQLLRSIDTECRIELNNLLSEKLQVFGEPHRLRQTLANLTQGLIKQNQPKRISISCEATEELHNQLSVAFKISAYECQQLATDQILASQTLTQNISDTRNKKTHTPKHENFTVKYAIDERVIEYLGGELHYEHDAIPAFSFCFPYFKLTNPPIAEELLHGLRAISCGFDGARLATLSNTLEKLKIQHSIMSIADFSSLLHQPDLLDDNSNQTWVDIVFIDITQMGTLYSEAPADWVQALRQHPHFASTKCVAIGDSVLAYCQSISAGFDLYLTQASNISTYYSSICALPWDQQRLLHQADSKVSKKLLQQQKMRLRNARVLLVEDSPVNEMVFSAMLKKLLYQFETVNSAEAAQVALKATHFDLILMDCNLPDMDGFTLTRLIREGQVNPSLSNVSIIAITAMAMPGDQQKCIESGMDDYVSKPCTLELLRQKISLWLTSNNIA